MSNQASRTSHLFGLFVRQSRKNNQSWRGPTVCRPPNWGPLITTGSPLRQVNPQLFPLKEIGTPRLGVGSPGESRLRWDEDYMRSRKGSLESGRPASNDTMKDAQVSSQAQIGEFGMRGTSRL
ncbi:hypothetical protein NPIL_636061 [Nephila pilipes]|uniref:Uncharacterized protein n=1 Tax=Nephila pilipes TaxID=299642 RepID=A0A8X6TVK9_NEPPI|nr:hypothetical protein NPIL_636061 [Nephila pilipes]